MPIGGNFAFDLAAAQTNFSLPELREELYQTVAFDTGIFCVMASEEKTGTAVVSIVNSEHAETNNKIQENPVEKTTPEVCLFVC